MAGTIYQLRKCHKCWKKDKSSHSLLSKARNKDLNKAAAARMRNKNYFIFIYLLHKILSRSKDKYPWRERQERVADDCRLRTIYCICFFTFSASSYFGSCCSIATHATFNLVQNCGMQHMPQWRQQHCKRHDAICTLWAMK